MVGPAEHGAHGVRDKELDLALKDGNPGEEEVALASSEENKDWKETEEDEIIYSGGAAQRSGNFDLWLMHGHLRGGFRQQSLHSLLTGARSHIISILVTTPLATAIPRITTVFDSLNHVGWYSSSYRLTTCSLQPSFGRIYTYFDVR
ncbi:MAG: MFS general substrate transporter [Lasallia pustulata]|uniref:MFS general substrate transporter n=1 Tax=Lasallia pustulata TaxID=136370 RepID=A0A1W5CS99_9LECA|nr:MAG: MFS general substrate transporter [Lasallia pustulata]SLM33539.1 mfs transporter [Lasallia pustulata]